MMGRREALSLVGIIATWIALLLLFDRLTPWVTPDTMGYFAPAPWPEILGQVRAPLFGLILGPLTEGGTDLRFVPVLQQTAFMFASLFLYSQLRQYGLSVIAGTAVLLSVLFSNVVVIWGNAAHPEVLAVAAMLACIGLGIRIAIGGGGLAHYIGILLFTGIAYILRPSMLTLIPVLPVFLVLAMRMQDEAINYRRVIIVAIMCATPFFAISSLRYAVVGDFNIVSFGGFQSSGMAAFMLREETVPKLPPDIRDLASRVLSIRVALEDSGDVIRIPFNSQGVRSFESVALGYYDIFARSYDSLLHGGIASISKDYSDWVTFNQEMMKLSASTIVAEPQRYAAWIVGGVTRSIGRIIVTNLPMMIALIALVILLLKDILMSRHGPSKVVLNARADCVMLTVLAGGWIVATLPLTVITTFPAGRYIDTAGLLLPALPAYAALVLAARR